MRLVFAVRARAAQEAFAPWAAEASGADTAAAEVAEREADPSPSDAGAVVEMTEARVARNVRWSTSAPAAER